MYSRTSRALNVHVLLKYGFYKKSLRKDATQPVEHFFHHKRVPVSTRSCKYYSYPFVMKKVFNWSVSSFQSGFLQNPYFSVSTKSIDAITLGPPTKVVKVSWPCERFCVFWVW